MEISFKGFILPKTSEKFSDCFDRYGYNINNNKFAVSDGVSKSFFPDIWADLLVNSFVNNQGQININDLQGYKDLQKEWYEKVKEIVERPNQKYFVRNFFYQGRPAAATFVGLHFFKEEEKFKWESIALGDSFLFFIPESINNINDNFDKITFFSSKQDFRFDNFPDFFDSRNPINKGKIKYCKRNLESGTFYLLTDALAEWFVAEKQNAVDIILNWENQNDFLKSITDLRKITLHNDDSTVIIIKVNEDNSSLIHYKDHTFSDLKSLIVSETESLKIKESVTLGQKPEIELESFEKTKSVDSQQEENQGVNNPNTDTLINISKKSLNPDSNNKPDQKKKRRISFWETISYRFWGFWESNEISENDSEVTDLNINKKESESFDSVETSDNNDQNDCKSTSKKKTKKATPNPKSHQKDDDISSITDKF